MRTRYIIVSDVVAQAFVKQVNEHLDAGAELVGGVAYWGNRLSQALLMPVREDDGGKRR